MSPAHVVIPPEQSPAPPADPAVLRADIAVARAELGDTLEALSAKFDVKARAAEAVADVRGRLGRVPVVAVLAGVAAVAVGLLTWHAVKGRTKR